MTTSTSDIQTAQFTISVDASMKRAIKQALKQLKGVMSVKETTPKCRMTEKQYYEMLDHSIEQANNGETIAMNEGESVEQFLNRLVCTQ